MINRKTPYEIELMVQSGKIANIALKNVVSQIRPGITTLELEKIAENTILELGATPSFKTVDDYPYATCININSGIVHGMPNSYKVKSGDIVSIDLGALLQGYHSDLSYTVEVETTNETKFLDVGRKALEAAIKQCRVGKKVGDISFAMQTIVEDAGYSVSELLVGHGIGKELHEDPYVPCLGWPNTGPKIKSGMVFAIEVIYQKGKPELKESSDGWTLETEDGSLSGLFEKTIAVDGNGPIVITDFLLS